MKIVDWYWDKYGEANLKFFLDFQIIQISDVTVKRIAFRDKTVPTFQVDIRYPLKC